MQRFLRAFWPMLIWMGVVFTLSTDLFSAEHTGRIIEPLLRWFDPGISAGAIAQVHFLVRKTGHITEYAVLALLVLRGLRVSRAVPVTRWSWPLALVALAASAGYAGTDEFHQIFVPSRGPSVHDVAIDTGGALLGLLIAFWWTRTERTAAAIDD